MFYKSINKKLFLIILIIILLFLITLSFFEVFLIPKFFDYNNSIKVDKIENKIKTDIKQIDSFDELTSYLFELSYSQNVYITLYSLDTHEIAWDYLTQENVLKIKKQKKGEVSERIFPIVMDFGVYNISILSYTRFDNYLKDSLITTLSFIFILGFLFILFFQFVLSKLFTIPLIKVVNNLDTASKNKKYYKRIYNDRFDEIGKLDKEIAKLSKKYYDIIRELKRDETLKEEKEVIQRENLAIVSHELKTPLTVLKLQTECMIAGIGEYKNHNKYLKENLKNISRLEELVLSILESIKIDQEEFELVKEETEIDVMIQKIVKNISILLEQKNIKIEYEMKSVTKEIDIKLFKRALKNIIENAVKYSDENTVIKIILDEDFLEVININTKVAEQDFKDIFKPFVRVDKARNSRTGGTGIGLYIVGKILEKHKFSFSLENIRNKVIFKINF